jgi:hypothetical protein
MRPRPPGRTRDLPGSDGLLLCVMGSSTTAERRRLAVTALPLLPSALSTASASAICNFRGSITHPTQSLCTLRSRRRRRPRNTRYQAGATPYLGRTSTGWITSASPDALTVYSTSHRSGGSRPGSPCARGFGPGLPGCKGAAEPPLERCDPFRRPKRSSDAGRPLDPGRCRRVGRCREERSKIGDQREQGLHHCQLVIRPARRARALDHGQSSAATHQPRDHRIEHDVTRRRQQVRLVHHDRAEAPRKRCPVQWNLVLMAPV